MTDDPRSLAADAPPAAGHATQRAKNALTLVIAAGFPFLFFALGWSFIHANSQTSDEALHLAAGYSYVLTQDFRLNREHPPFIKELAGLAVYLRYRLPFEPDPGLWAQALRHPLAGLFIGRDFVYRAPVPADDLLRLGRLPNLALGTILVALVGWWAYRLWGRRAGLVALALAALEPNLIAHSSLVTTDLGAALFTFLAVYLLWELGSRPSWWRLEAVGIATGLALASKYSAVLLLALGVVVVAGHVAQGGSLPMPGRPRPDGLIGRAREAARSLGLIVVVAVLTVAACYLFRDFTSWWAGVAEVAFHQGAGHPAFFLGDYSVTGWWSYFLVAFLVKTPLGSLFLIGASIVLYRAGRPWTSREAIFLLVPPAMIFAVMTLGRINIGLRHVLVVYPFLFVAASRLATVRLGGALTRPLLVAVPLVATAVSSVGVAPHQLAYFNELIGGPGEGYRYLGDSNLDWGQDLQGVRTYVRQRRLPIIYLSYFGNVPGDAYGFRYQYVPSARNVERVPPDLVPLGTSPEVLAISVFNLQGIFLEDVHLYRWLWSRTPIAKIGYSIYVYDLTRDADAHVELAKVYVKQGLRELTIPELTKALAIDPGHREAARLLASFSRRAGD